MISRFGKFAPEGRVLMRIMAYFSLNIEIALIDVHSAVASETEGKYPIDGLAVVRKGKAQGIPVHGFIVIINTLSAEQQRGAGGDHLGILIV